MPRWFLSTFACSAGVFMLMACGRLGFELHDLDAGAPTKSTNGTNGTSPPPRATPQAGRTAMDAGAGPRDAGSKDSGTSSRLANAAACSGDDMCQSGACVDGNCCESHCDSPPTCYVADGATCSTGYCRYVAAESGTACDDANSCTRDDVCSSGSCGGHAECDDANKCTVDFCGADRCAHASSCEPRGMPCSYAQRLGIGYWLCPGPVDFDAARGECKRIGAKLVTVDSEVEQRALWQLGMRDTWIGYRAPDADSDAGFEWLDGESDFQNWSKDREDDSDEDAGTSDRCAYLAASNEGAWRSHDCSDKFAGFACEIEQYAPPEADCSYERRGGHGYFSCGEQRTWLDAAERCAVSNAYLVEFDNTEEQNFVVAKLLKQGADARYAIGASDAKAEGKYVTSRNGALRFSAWADGEPNNTSADNDFAVLQRDGTWRSVGPAERSYYICEQEG
jgi:hypothetical protein